MTSLKEITSKKGKFVIFKHSTRCPISINAKAQVDQYKALPKSLEVILIPVLKQTKLKFDIAAQYKVKHESPQILLVKDQTCLKNFSHEKVTLKNLQKL